MAAQNRNRKVKRLALMGLLFALAMALSFLESLLPALPMLPPGIRLGLSNIVTMYALFALGPVSGYTIAVLKSLFVLPWQNRQRSCIGRRQRVRRYCLSHGHAAAQPAAGHSPAVPAAQRFRRRGAQYGPAHCGPVHHQQSICLVLLAGSFSGGTAHGRHHRDGPAGCHALSGPLKPKINN